MAHVDALLVQSDSDCPSADAVQAEVRELTTPEQRRGVRPGTSARVSDRGESIAISMTRDGKTTVRVYRDAARDCARRAHFVSVLVVVSLIPPDLGSDPEPSPPEPEPEPEPSPVATPVTPAPPPPPVVEPPPPARHVRIELAARAEASTAISDSVRATIWGGSLGVALGAGRLRFTLATGYAPKTDLRYTGEVAGHARFERLDVSLGARLAQTHALVDTSIDAGLLLTRAVVSGRSSRQPAEDAAFSAGGHFGVQAHWSDRSRVSPFLGAYANVFPFAPALSQLPQGTVGHLPYVWVGLSAGLALAL